jgi:hypothetical protein
MLALSRLIVTEISVAAKRSLAKPKHLKKNIVRVNSSEEYDNPFVLTCNK